MTQRFTPFYQIKSKTELLVCLSHYLKPQQFSYTEWSNRLCAPDDCIAFIKFTETF